jgi:hypothetical protein
MKCIGSLYFCFRFVPYVVTLLPPSCSLDLDHQVLDLHPCAFAALGIPLCADSLYKELWNSKAPPDQG